MALSRTTTWSAGQTLTASALNGEFNNILDNALSLISPLTGALDFNGNVLQNLSAGAVGSPSLYFSSDSDTGIYRSAANTFDVTVGGIRGLSVSSVTGATSYLAVGHSAVTAMQAVTLTPAGTATDILLRLVPKGTGYVEVAAGGSGEASFLPGLAFAGFTTSGLHATTDSTSLIVNGRRVLMASAYTSATNYLRVTPAPSGSPVVVDVAGGDSAPELTIGRSGMGAIRAATDFIPAALASNPPTANSLLREQIPRAWISFTGSTGAIDASFNVASLTRHATGDYTLEFRRAFASTPYTMAQSCERFGSTTLTEINQYQGRAQTTTDIRLVCKDTGGTDRDPPRAMLVFFGNQ